MGRRITLEVSDEIIETCAQRGGFEEDDVPQLKGHITEVLDAYVESRTYSDVKYVKKSIRWPDDWQVVMGREWGVGYTPSRIRAIIYLAADDDPKHPLSTPPVFSEGSAKGPSHDKKSVGYGPQKIWIPPDWHERIVERAGDGKVTTWINAMIYPHLNRVRRKKEPLSIPRGTQQYME